MKRSRSRTSKRTNLDPSLQRINKVLAAAGLGSRRDVEELILQGRVEIDGTTVTNLATRVNPQEAKIEVDGQVLKRPKLVYYALNKPKGVLSTSSDPSGRMRVIDFVPDKHRVFSVGRLDRYSEGLMLLTNDGDLAQRLAHPRFRVQKTYFVVVAGILTIEELAKLRKGVYLAEGMARIDGARIRKTRKTCTELEILLSEGKNREIRRILARAGHKVVLLRRLAIGPLRLAELPVGAARELTANEIKALYAATEVKAAPKSKPEVAREEQAAPPVEMAKVVTPIESDGFDDFGVGLEGDYEYDESQLVLTDDVVEFGASTEEEMDDDFVADFESLSAGAVLDYEEDEVNEELEDQPSRPRSPSRNPERGSDRRDRMGRDSGGRSRGGRDSAGRDGSSSSRGGRFGAGRERFGSRDGDRTRSRSRGYDRDDNRGQRGFRPADDRRDDRYESDRSEGGRDESDRSEGGRGAGRSRFGNFGNGPRGSRGSNSGGRFQSEGRSGRYGAGQGSSRSGSGGRPGARGGRRPFGGAGGQGRQPNQNSSYEGDFSELFGDGQDGSAQQSDRTQGNRNRRPGGGNRAGQGARGGFAGRGGPSRGGEGGRGGAGGRGSFGGRDGQRGRSKFPRNDRSSGWGDQGESRQEFESDGEQRSNDRSFGKRPFNRRPGSGQSSSFESGERRPERRSFGNGGSRGRDSGPGGRTGGRPGNRLGGRPSGKPGKKRPGGPRRDRD